MGAFDGELYSLGYRFSTSNAIDDCKSEARIDKEKFNAALHVAKMPCPASCGSACANHFCPAHNGSAYVKQIKKKFARNARAKF